MITFQITGPALGLVNGLGQNMKTGAVKIIAKAIKNTYQAHFRMKDEEPNKRSMKGWPKSGMWAKMAMKTTVAYAFDNRAGISIADPIINQKVYGGIIKPKTKKTLAIPATGEAYAAGSPREGGAPELTFAWSFDEERNKWRPSLVAKSKYLRITKKGERKRTTKKTMDKATTGIGDVWYWLVKSVNQDPDPTALPEDAIVLSMMRETAKAYAIDLMRQQPTAEEE